MLVDTMVHNHVRINFRTIMHMCKLIRTADQLALHDLLAGLPSFGCLLLDTPGRSSSTLFHIDIRDPRMGMLECKPKDRYCP